MRTWTNVLLGIVFGGIAASAVAQSSTTSPATGMETRDPDSIPAKVMADTVQMDIKDIKFSGFLGDYSMLKPGGQDSAALLWIKPGIDANKYPKVLIEEPVIYLKANGSESGVAIKPKELADLAEYFRDALVYEVDDGYELADRPGPGVLVLRVAITGVEPAGGKVSRAVKWLTKVNLSLGSATIEGELLDGATGERLAAFVDGRVGTRVGIGGGMTEWSHAKLAFKKWAARFRTRLDAWHGVQAGG